MSASAVAAEARTRAAGSRSDASSTSTTRARASSACADKSASAAQRTSSLLSRASRSAASRLRRRRAGPNTRQWYHESSRLSVEPAAQTEHERAHSGFARRLIAAGLDGLHDGSAHHHAVGPLGGGGA